VTDDLTSLPNRRMLMQHIEEAITTTRPSGGSLAVLMLDLDNFKQLNDTLGHQAGDWLLRLIGPRLEAVLPDDVSMARLGGDEFAILLHPAPEREHVAVIADAVLRALNAPFTIQGLALRVTGSLGIATFPADADDAEELMRHADIAMYQAKTARSKYEFYDHDRNDNSWERLALAAELAVALEGESIEVHFQPQSEVRTRRIVGVEALVRWRRADGRLVPPSDFVAAAEAAGLSRRLTSRVIEVSLAQARAWRDRGYRLHIAVNTTVADLLDEAFPAEVAAALDRHQLPADALVLEVTESSVLVDPERIGKTLGRLRELGIELSLDDFGTGYSSLAHLKLLPVTEIKIDRSFVAHMCTEPTDSAIVYAMIALARKLGIRVVAEGVEDRQTWDELKALDCELIQGYLISRPVPAADLEHQLRAQGDQLLGSGEDTREALRRDQLDSQRPTAGLAG
jgi:diguanylate cyclase (GGDEF)-like protein